MKSVEPSADLPPASSNTMLTYSALPVRRPYQNHKELPKNMTGVFLSQGVYGLPSNKQQEQRIPPLARPRGLVYKPQTLSGYHAQGKSGGNTEACGDSMAEGVFPVFERDEDLGSGLTVTVTTNRAYRDKIATQNQMKAAELIAEQAHAIFPSEVLADLGTDMGIGSREGFGNIGLGPAESRTNAVRPYFKDSFTDLNCDFISPNILTHPVQLFLPPSTSLPYCYIPPNLPYAPPLRLHLPIPPHPKHQHRHDTMMRRRGDIKAFQPLPMKRSKPKVPRHEYHSPSPHIIGSKPDYSSVTRKSARNHVPASNDGVTHFEDMRSLSSGGGGSSHGSSERGRHAEVEEVETMLEGMELGSRESEGSLAGLVECYKKICKGNASSIHNLMAARTSPISKHKRKKMPSSNAPMMIRSFRNPQHPHSVVPYSNPRDRTGSPHSVVRPPVPAPYFYSSRGLPQTTDEGGNRVKLSRLPGATARSSDAVLAAPGAGSISRSTSGRLGGLSASLPGSSHHHHHQQHHHHHHHHHHHQQLPDGLEGTRPPTLPINTKIYALQQENFNVPSSTPVASTVDISKMSEMGESRLTSSPEPGQRHPVVDLSRAGGLEGAGSLEGAGTSSAPSSLNGSDPAPSTNAQGGADGLELTSVTGDESLVEGEGSKVRSPPGLEVGSSLAILLSVEDAEGNFQTVDLEEAEQEMKQSDSSHSESDVTANEVAEKVKESQAQKQAELDQLLEEHHQLVSQIEELEKIKGDSDTEDQGVQGDQE